MSESEMKKIAELRVVDLRAELEKRCLDKNGVKKDLVERLQKALQNEGRDSEALSSEGIGKKTLKRTSAPTNANDVNVSEKTDADDSKSEEKPNTDELVKNNTVEVDQVADTSPQEEKTDNDNKDSNNAESREKVAEAVVETDKSDQEQDKKTTATENVQDQQSPTTETPQVEDKKNEEVQSTPPISGTGGEETTQQKKAPSSPRILWISNVPKNTRANEIKQLLSSCGKVLCAKVVVNARFPGSCCFGYVTMGSAEDATNVITKLNNTEFDGHIIKIDKFENVKPNTLNPARKKSLEELKRSNEKKEDKAKKSPENKPTENVKNDDKGTADQISERRKSLASEQSSRGRIRTRSRERLSKERIREREHDRNASLSVRSSDARQRANVLTFDKIKEERERQRMRDRERALREENRRLRQEEIKRLRAISDEAQSIQRERDKLRMERDKIEKEKHHLLKLERERHRIERKKLELEKMELERTRQRLEEDRRAVKRPMPMAYRHDHEESFDDRKRMAPEPERHFDRPATAPRFDAPSYGSNVASKKFASKDYNKRVHDGFPNKRGPDFNSERMHQGSIVNRSEENLAKYNRSYDDRDPARDLAGPIRPKDNRFNDRERSSPQFRQMSNADRHMSSSGKPERKNFEQSGDRWNQSSNTQSKFGGSSSQNQWGNKGSSTWRMEPATNRWASSTPSSGRSVGQYSGNKFGPACPPPPGINTYDYSKPTGGRRY